MLNGKNAVITGSTSGIGLATAELLAAKGCNVVINSFTDSEDDHRIASELAKKQGVDAIYVKADMSKTEEARGLIEQASAKLGSVDILVNNAGIQYVADRRISDHTMERHPGDQPLRRLPHIRRSRAGHARQWLGPHRQHRLGAWPARLAAQGRLCRGQARHRRPHQGGRRRTGGQGRHLQRGLPRLRSHSAGREADRGPDEGNRLRPRQDHPRRHPEKQPSKQFATVEQIAASVAFLASDDAAQITGTTLSIDGGWTAQ